MSVLIQGGTVVNDDFSFEADVLLENGIISEVKKGIAPPKGAKVVDAKGLLVIPGGIDPHVHFEFYFMDTRTADDFYTGSCAALAGGTTMIIDFAVRKNRDLLETYSDYRAAADEKIGCDYGLHMVVTKFDAKTAKHMETLVKEKGINSFKMFMCYKGELMVPEPDLLKVFETCSKIGALAQVHAEDGELIYENQKKILSLGITGPEGHLYSREEEVETETTHRAIMFANQLKCPLYVVHVMCKGAADVIAKKKLEGCVVFGEPLGSGLGMDGSHIFNKCWKHAAGHLISPPLRPDPSTPGHLMDLLANGGMDLVGSDHCTFNSSQKAIGKDDFSRIPNGINGVEERMTIVWDRGVNSGKLSPNRFVAVTSTNAAKIFNVYPKKGRIQVGSDADVVVWNPNKVRTFSVKTQHAANDFNVFDGMTCKGGPAVVISRGKVVFENEKLTVERGSGRFVPTPGFSPYVYATIQKRKTILPKKIEREPYRE